MDFSLGYEPLNDKELLNVTNQKPVDGWTAVHVMAGIGAAAIGLPWWLAIGGAVAYEFLEHRVESDPDNVFGTSGPEVLSNAIIDVLVFAAAYAATKPNR